MIHTFKACGTYFSVDSRDGSIRLIDPLMFDMIPYIEAEGIDTPELPMGVRYAFAKYDSKELARAYAELFDMYSVDKPETVYEKVGACIFSPELPVNADSLAKIPDGAVATIVIRDSSALSAAKDYVGSATIHTAVFDESLLCGSDDTCLIFTFDSAENLTSQVNGYFSRGINSIAGYPSGALDDAAVCGAYEKLCRELVRMKKKGLGGRFVPFSFEASHGKLVTLGADGMSDYRGGTFSSVYTRGGMMPLNSALVKSDAVLDCLAECAIVMQNK